MAISKIQNISKEELTRIEKVIGESFVTNELFHNWGTIEERRSAVLAYMKIYVDCVYRVGELYGNETLTGFVGIEDTRRPATAAKINMLLSQNRAYIDIPKQGEIKKMKIIEYFTSENKKHWLDEMKKCDWGAGQYLHQLLSENSLKRMVGETALVPMLVDGDKLIAFCTFAPLDDIQPTEMSPWIGFVYTFPDYRGHRYVGMLLDYAESIATVMDREYIYISTGHTGLYEKYGYEFYKMDKDIEGEKSRIYRKALAVEEPDKDRRCESGAKWKSEIVKAARENVDMTAYCGFSCNHCFLGEWCGGCRSVFSCCSYGTLYDKGKCPNIDCCEKKGLDGCYECEDLKECTKGFYQPDNDGASACKAQAMFIHKYGKEKFFYVHDKLHEVHDFKKTQEILGTDAEEGLKILERYL